MTTDLDAHQGSDSAEWSGLGLESATVQLVPWTETMPGCFNEEALRVEGACGDRVVGIEHVGSTSVKGLSCRPIIDLLVGVDHLRDASECIDPLKESGYRCHGENGIAGRRYFTRMIDRRCVVQLHMVQVDGEFWKNAIRFRDMLRTDPSLLSEYAQAKEELQAQFSADPVSYEEARAAFEHAVLT